jgi:hypothetical protein
MRTTTSWLPRAGGLLATVLLAACTATPGASPTPGQPETTSRATPGPLAAETVPPSPAPIVGEVPSRLVDAARADLAARIGADAAAAAEIVVAESVTWPDGSLGCPVPGEMYVQVLTPGYRLVFEADDVRYDYRLTEAGAVSLCVRPRPVP